MRKFDRVLVDGDILVYRIGFTTQDVDEQIARWRLNELVERLTAGCNAKEAAFYITSTDKSNFRFGLFPEYKAHRAKKEKPIHYDYIRQVLQEDYLANVVHGEEADDALGIELTLDPEKRVLASIDKDLNQVPGWHFNFVKEQIYYVNELEGWRNLYYQMLVGDKPTDNVEGCPKIGDVKATRSLEGCESEEEMFETVTRLYLKAYSDPRVASERLWLAGNLLWVRRKPNQPWVRPSGEVVSKTALKQYYETEEWNSSTSPESGTTSSQPPPTDTLVISPSVTFT